MPQSPSYTTPLEHGKFYHIYNRGNNRQDVFKAIGDYQLFLNKWREFIYPVAKTFAYSLLPNHFHALVQIREKEDLAGEGRLAKSGTNIVHRAFTNFFISYSRTMQNRHGFHGAVFHSPFKRKIIADDFYFDHVLAYIHYNAQKHGVFNGELHDYQHSSYRALISNSPTLLERDYVIDYFGGRDKFIAYHQRMHELFDLRDELEI